MNLGGKIWCRLALGPTVGERPKCVRLTQVQDHKKKRNGRLGSCAFCVCTCPRRLQSRGKTFRRMWVYKGSFSCTRSFSSKMRREKKTKRQWGFLLQGREKKKRGTSVRGKKKRRGRHRFIRAGRCRAKAAGKRGEKRAGRCAEFDARRDRGLLVCAADAQRGCRVV